MALLGSFNSLTLLTFTLDTGVQSKVVPQSGEIALEGPQCIRVTSSNGPAWTGPHDTGSCAYNVNRVLWGRSWRRRHPPQRGIRPSDRRSRPIPHAAHPPVHVICARAMTLDAGGKDTFLRQQRSTVQRAGRCSTKHPDSAPRPHLCETIPAFLRVWMLKDSFPPASSVMWPSPDQPTGLSVLGQSILLRFSATFAVG